MSTFTPRRRINRDYLFLFENVICRRGAFFIHTSSVRLPRVRARCVFRRVRTACVCVCVIWRARMTDRRPSHKTRPRTTVLSAAFDIVLLGFRKFYRRPPVVVGGTARVRRTSSARERRARRGKRPLRARATTPAGRPPCTARTTEPRCPSLCRRRGYGLRRGEARRGKTPKSVGFSRTRSETVARSMFSYSIIVIIRMTRFRNSVNIQIEVECREKFVPIPYERLRRNVGARTCL